MRIKPRVAGILVGNGTGLEVLAAWSREESSGDERRGMAAKLRWRGEVFGVTGSRRRPRDCTCKGFGSMGIARETVMQIAGGAGRRPETGALENGGEKAVAGFRGGAGEVAVTVNSWSRPKRRQSKGGIDGVGRQRRKRKAKTIEHHTRFRPGLRERVQVRERQA